MTMPLMDESHEFNSRGSAVQAEKQRMLHMSNEILDKMRRAQTSLSSTTQPAGISPAVFASSLASFQHPSRQPSLGSSAMSPSELRHNPRPSVSQGAFRANPVLKDDARGKDDASVVGRGASGSPSPPPSVSNASRLAAEMCKRSSHAALHRISGHAAGFASAVSTSALVRSGVPHPSEVPPHSQHHPHLLYHHGAPHEGIPPLHSSP
ncbi:hypothetical protein T484DRAFT_1938313 [Baffinella frigidus]|nr:hypothetical protein T484DRAFT_1938313 [Cryptophyta sp. CCMP2293]